MKSLLFQLRSRVSDALVSAFGEAGRVDPVVLAAKEPKFGDYQCNVAMSLAKSVGAKPRDVAQKIVDALNALEAFRAMCDQPEIAGPGFINLRLRDAFLGHALASIPAPGEQDRLGIDAVEAGERQTVIVDYSSPNVAKQMHVGHIRSTIIGDVFARVLAFEGHDVIRQNHLGDWGTQFGMIILGIWHIYSSRENSDPIGHFRSRAAELRAIKDAPVQRRVEELASYCRTHQEALDGDPTGAGFDTFLDEFTPDFELLLAAYQYVSALEAAAEGTDLVVLDRRNGRAIPLAEISKHVAAMLQGAFGDSRQELKAWRKATDATLRECDAIYRRLGVLLNSSDARGESFFHPLLAGIVEELRLALGASDPERKAGTTPEGVRAVCREDKGALCIFLENADGSPAFKGPAGDALPILVQKSDGAYLYATTDLAAALFRTASRKPMRPRLLSRSLAAALDDMGGGLGGDRVLYVVGSPQKLHFQMFFTAVRALGWTRGVDGKPEARLEHVMFGSVLGDDRKLLRTRSGESIKLKDLLDEAVQRAEAQIRETEADAERRRGFTEEEICEVAETIGIGAVKYADLCQNRMTDYVFNWDKMLSLQGNTAPYLMYAYARIRSIYRKGGGIEGSRDRGIENAGNRGAIGLAETVERALGVRILQLAETIDAVGESLLPNILCDYLYDLAGRFMVFYEACPVLQAPDEETRASRLRLCELTARALRLGLGLLGISTLERM